MRIKLYLFLPEDQAQQLVRDGFPQTGKSYRLNPVEYTACSAFNPQRLVEVLLELQATELARYRHELELVFDDDIAGADISEAVFAEEEESAVAAVEPIYWYELPASVLRETCRSCRMVTRRGGD